MRGNNMSAVIQYSFFESKEESELKCLQKHIEKLEAAIDKQRKCQFSKIGSIQKQTNDIDLRLLNIEKHICHV
jgi:hypothetical protein